MRLPSLPAGIARLAVAACVAAVATAPATAPAIAAAPALIGPASFNPATSAITFSYTGTAPTQRLYRISGTHFYYDFHPARLARGGVQYKRVGSPLERFTLANRPTGQAVRLSFTLTKAGAAPAIVVDTAAHTIRVLPLGAEAPSVLSAKPLPPRRTTPIRPRQAAPRQQARPGIQKSAIGRPYLDETRGMIVVPFQGPTPEFRSGVLETDRRWVYFDFDQAIPAAGPRPYGRFADKVFLRWAMARRPQRTAATRLSVRLAAARTLSTEVHPEVGQIWITVPDRFPPSQLSVQPEPVPPAMLPFPLPSGISTPTPVTPEGSPLPSEAPTAPPTPTPAPSATPDLVKPQPLLTPPPAPSPRPTRKPTPKPTTTPKPKPTIATRFGGAYYDHGRQALVVSYTGAVPAYSLQALSPTSLELDFPRTALDKKGTLMQAFSYHPVLTRWMAKELSADGLVRFTFNTAAPGEVLVAVDAARKQLLILPQLQGDLELPTPAPATSTTFTRAYYDTATGALVLPYQGQTPLYAISPISANYVYLDFIYSGLSPAGVQFETLPPNTGLAFWLLAKRPDCPVVRVSANLPFPGYLRVLDDKANQRLMLVPTRVAPSPAPSPAP
ncbi:MAG: hypothetical protein ACK46X_01815 [Candidatus Sericytochromatia bacterium]